VVIQLSLSQFTVKSLQSINSNPSQAEEWLVRYFQGQGFPIPISPKTKGLRVILSVNISPYAVGILQNFTPFGLNPSQTVDCLMQVYSNTNWIKVKEPKVQKIKREKKLNRVR
jgi:hypothetical protein